MKFVLTFILIVSLFGILSAGDEHKPAASTPQFDKMKSLAGTWRGKDPEGKEFTMTYKIVSNGSAVIETMIGEGHADEMITVYHLNGKKLMLTHYCAAGNQPRMVAKKTTDSTITFSYLDATNLESPNDGYMSGLVVTFKDDDHFSQQWTMTKDKKESGHVTFEYERVHQ